MQLRGKFYIAPDDIDANATLKELLVRLVREGAGRPVGRDGVPPGPWTAESLAQTIGSLRGNGHGVDVRTVQRWLQESGHGINPNNIHRLAQIFGCGDPDAILKWQVRLIAARGTPVQRRKSNARGAADPSIAVTPNAVGNGLRFHSQVSKRDIGHRVNSMFAGRSSLNLPVTVWAGVCTLWFLAYGLGIHDITYAPVVGISKQVGLFWSPSWNIGEALFIPLFLIVVSDILSYWMLVGRSEIIFEHNRINPSFEVAHSPRSHRVAYLTIALVSLMAITILQWAGVYLMPFIEQGYKPPMIDWILVSLVRPDIVSLKSAFLVSIIAYIYNGYIYWLFLNGSMILYQIVTDFADLCYLRSLENDTRRSVEIVRAADVIQDAVYKGTVYGCILAICVKLNATYLVSDGANIFTWLMNDAASLFGATSIAWAWIDGRSPSNFSSVLLLFVVLFVYTKAELQLRKARLDFGGLQSGANSPRLKGVVQPVIVASLTIAFLTTGAYCGFSVFTILAMALSLITLYVFPNRMVSS